MFLHLDCRHYLGDRPCRFKRACEECPHYEPMGPRVLIIKLGALGDVVRTACLLPALMASDEPPFVTWVTSPAALPLVQRMPGVHRALTFEPATLTHLEIEHFDTLISLDKEPAPAALAMRVRAENKLGVGLSRYGTAFPLNEQCEYYFSLGLDDDEKFHRNQKSYPQLVYEALGWTYTGQEYQLVPTQADRAAADQRLASLGVKPGRRAVGINPGAGAVFANKAWREEGTIDLIRRLGRERPEVDILLLGGRAEAELLGRLQAAAGDAPVYNTGADNPMGTSLGLIERCEVVVAGDTLAMHMALAAGRRAVAIFGPTCAQEIDLFGRGEKIVTPIDCAPCYRRTCDRQPNCQDMIDTQTVLDALTRQLAQAEKE